MEIEEEEDPLLNGSCQSDNQDFFIMDGIQSFSATEVHNDVKPTVYRPQDILSRSMLQDALSHQPQDGLSHWTQDGLSHTFNNQEMSLKEPKCMETKPRTILPNPHQTTFGLYSSIVPRPTDFPNPRNIIPKTSNNVLSLKDMKDIRQSPMTQALKMNSNSESIQKSSYVFPKVHPTATNNHNLPKIKEFSPPVNTPKPVVLSLEDVLKSGELKKMLSSKLASAKNAEGKISEVSKSTTVQSLRQYRRGKNESPDSPDMVKHLNPPPSVEKASQPFHKGPVELSSRDLGLPSPVKATPHDNEHKPGGSAPPKPKDLPLSVNVGANRNGSSYGTVTTGALSPNKTTILFIPSTSAPTDTTNKPVQTVVSEKLKTVNTFPARHRPILPHPQSSQSVLPTPARQRPILPRPQSVPVPETVEEDVRKSPEISNEIDTVEDDVSPVTPVVVETSEADDYEDSAPSVQTRNQEKAALAESRKADPDISVVQEKRRNDKFKNVVPHMVEDESDSDDVCIVKEDIKVPFKKKQRGKKRPMFKCSECEFKSCNMNQLQVHEKAHPRGRKIKCSKCPFETRIKSCMIYHANMHSGMKQFRCSKCNFQTDVLDKFISHEKQTVKCKVCGESFHLLKELKAHMPTHLEDSSPEPKAKKGRKKPTKSQKTENNKVQKRYNCQHCSFTTIYKMGLVRHVSVKHRKVEIRYNSKQGEFECSKCPYVTDERLFLEKHLKVHSNTPDLTSSPEKDIFKCAVCDFETEFDQMMQNHMSTHSESDSDFDLDADGLADQMPPGDTVPRAKEKFHCSNCSFKSDSEKLYDRHKSSHLRQKTFNIIMSSLFEK